MMQEKTAIITGGAGASAGASGRYISQRLAEMGYHAILWDIQDEAGEQTAAQIRQRGLKATYIRCDVCGEEQVKAALEQTISLTGQVDVLVNNAFWHADIQPPLHEVTLEDWDRHMAINLRCHFIACKYVMGAATITWDTTSGGVMTAAVKKITTIITRRPFRIHRAFKSPRRFRITDTTGSSKTAPKTRNTVVRKAM